MGVVRGIRKGKQDYGIAIFGEKAILHSEDKPSGYRPLLVEIVKFFQTGVAPVSAGRDSGDVCIHGSCGREQGQGRSGGAVGEVKLV